MKKPKILSIDDEMNFTDFLKRYFEPRGYEIDVTSEGAKGLELLREKEYDVVLLDLRMAGLNGEEVMNLLSELNNDGTSIIMVTHSPSYAESANRVMHLFDGHIVTENIRV